MYLISEVLINYPINFCHYSKSVLANSQNDITKIIDNYDIGAQKFTFLKYNIHLRSIELGTSCYNYNQKFTILIYHLVQERR